MKFEVNENNVDVFDQSFSETLSELNQVVIDNPDPLEGNLFYHHHTKKLDEARPDPSRARKRRNFCLAMKGKKQLLEIGFNAGHSALMACANNPDLHYTGIDICGFSYIEPCAEILKARFKDRFTFHKGDSREVLPSLFLQTDRFDIFHIDGSHTTTTAKADVINCLHLHDSSVTAHVLLDDTQLRELSEMFSDFCEKGILTVDDLDGKWQKAFNILGRINN